MTQAQHIISTGNSTLRKQQAKATTQVPHSLQLFNSRGHI
ncbi:hypothetical protein NP493_6207g00001 [Ridgeia piscesae]|uniref:Uncharacterized protein n=1 Tax=Ridgeia piscesae TaxID=27915 RepID=A0AAD9ITE5_RIDPI|nr:hypothetical protein NP493_6207g00001 [Ridgeia piscesae]